MFHVLMSTPGPSPLPHDFRVLLAFVLISPAFLLLGLIVGWVCHYFMDVPLGRAMGAGALSSAVYGGLTFVFLANLGEISFITLFVGIPVVSILAACFACWMLDRDDQYTSNTEVTATGDC